MSFMSYTPEGREVATFAMGCFWGPQLLFDRIEGVTESYVGYTQGNVANPTYEQVCSGSTNHTEGIQIYFDPQVVSYRSLLDTMLGHADPTTMNRQGNDRGTTYRSGIYYHSEEQRQVAEQVRDEVNAQLAAGTYRGKAEGREWVAEIKPAVEFWRAEQYHQKYLQNGGRFGRKQNASKGATDDIRCYG
jgi:peptide-methionine (S)-S-oxide reductase